MSLNPSQLSFRLLLSCHRRKRGVRHPARGADSASLRIEGGTAITQQRKAPAPPDANGARSERLPDGRFPNAEPTPACGYRWRDAWPGNDLAVTHEAYSERLVRADTARLVEHRR
jgi:hypothetical protein